MGSVDSGGIDLILSKEAELKAFDQMPKFSIKADRSSRGEAKKISRRSDELRMQEGISPQQIQRENAAFKESFSGAEISNLAKAIGK